MSSDPAAVVAPGAKMKTPRWRVHGSQWLWVVLVFIGIAAVMASYEVFNTFNPPDRWPGYFAWDPETGQLLQPLTGPHPYQTFVLKSWLDADIPFVPLMAIPYLSFIALAPVVVPLLTLAFAPFRRFLTVGFALITAQILMDVAYFLFQTEVVRDEPMPSGFQGSLVNLVWGNDHPFNGYPSGHCAWATIAIIALWRLRRRIPKTAWILMAWMLLIYPATVMLRQHYLMDVYAGILLGFTCYWASAFVIEHRRFASRSEIEGLIAERAALAESSPAE